MFEEIPKNNNSNIIDLFIKPNQIIKIKSGIIYNFKRLIFNHEKKVIL